MKIMKKVFGRRTGHRLEACWERDDWFLQRVVGIIDSDKLYAASGRSGFLGLVLSDVDPINAGLLQHRKRGANISIGVEFHSLCVFVCVCMFFFYFLFFYFRQHGTFSSIHTPFMYPT